MSLRNSKKTKRIALGAIIGIFIFIEFFGLLLVPKPVKAQWQTFEVSSLPQQIESVLEDIGETLLNSALGALVQGASYFMRKLAYDVATYIGSGGKGQGALVFDKPAGQYFEELALNTAAEAIEEFGEGFGLDVCMPPDPGFTIGLKVGLSRLYDTGGTKVAGGAGPEPECSWQELSTNWENVDESNFGLDQAANFANSLDIGQTDFGIALGAMGRINNLRIDAIAGGEVEQMVGEGFKPVTDLISGNISTPAQTIKKEAETITGGKQMDQSVEQITGMYGAGAAELLPMMASVFLNTLVSQLFDQIFSAGIVPKKGGQQEVGVFDFFASSLVSNRKAAEKAFNFFFTAVPSKSEKTYDIVSDYASCPNNPGLNHCVMDADLRRAIELARISNPVTIGEAIEQGMLHDNWPLINPRREADNTNVQECYVNKYCYSNLQKLRKARILPLGFEIAALRSDPDTPWTLKQVMEGFDDCTYNDEGVVIPDPDKPFCHLINPNWIIRAPEAKCTAQVYGPELTISNAPQRREECADLATCVTEGPSGDCPDNYYSFCTKEKNIWRFGASVSDCDREYATCKTFTRPDGSFSSYLTRTIDYGECYAGAAGCRAYSMEKAGDRWVNSLEINTDYTKEGRNQIIYFNDNLSSEGSGCSQDADGCNAFYIAQKNDLGEYSSTFEKIYLKKAPEYLYCYDADPDTIAIDWPQNIQQILNNLPEKEDCDAFAQVCLEEEVGCQGYTPVEGTGPEVPGIVGANECADECVGYDAFRQEESSFDPPDYPLFFVPSQAQATMDASGQICEAQYVGCDEFTNLDAIAEGGEQKEYYSGIKYCEDPEIQNGEAINLKTYYSWEGSASEGFVLRVHKLRPVDAGDFSYMSLLGIDFLPAESLASIFPVGSPMYADDRADRLQYFYDTCNALTYNAAIENPGENVLAPDCRALYDADNNVFYRWINETITVSDLCHPLRKTESRLYTDESITNENVCLDRGGRYDSDTGECQRCYGGGRYVENPEEGGGSCVYRAITTESQECVEAANGCRKYTGNTGGNIENVFEIDTFEPSDPTNEDALNAAKEHWPEDTKVVAESTIVSQYSLEVDINSAGRSIDEEELDEGAWYELTFWARGEANNLTIYLSQDGNTWEFTKDIQTGQDLKVGISDTWQQYKVGPIQFTGDSAAQSELVFDRGTGGTYFLDNVQLQRVQEHIYLIRNSWQLLVQNQDGVFVVSDAPSACDSKPDDGFPGEALGCRSYTDRSGQTINTVGFERLCREKAIGCTALYDTFNTVNMNDEEAMHAYNVKCSLDTDTPVSSVTSCTINDNPNWQCSVLPGKTSCYVEEIIAQDVEELETLAGPDAIDESTIVIPEDTPQDSPIFLTNTPASACSELYMGCQRVGIEEQVLPESAQETAFKHIDTFIINDPREYLGTDGTLCRAGLIACTEFKTSGSVSYFKDPEITGNKLCEYKEATEERSAGWYIKDVGLCDGVSDSLCKTNDNCLEDAVCTDIGNVPCYPDYLGTGGEYGLWSNGSEQYEGYVGICPHEQDNCTELVDPADSSYEQPYGKPYYVIWDNEIDRRIGDCAGKVSLQEGCVLFDQTNLPNKLYDSALTYAESEKRIQEQKSSFTDPISSANNDSNVFIKVDRDRACSEWLDCKTWLPQKTDKGTTEKICYELRACNDTNGTNCTHWIEQTEIEEPFLSLEKYITRDTSWYGEDYTGYSMFNKYQIADFSYIAVEDKANVAYSVPRYFFEGDEDQDIIDCMTSAGVKDNWDTCGFDGAGRCLDGRCIYPIDGKFPAEANADTVSSVVAQALGDRGTCKAHPEQDSPFERSIATLTDPVDPTDAERLDFISNKPLFEGAHVCQEGECSCEYVKVTYKNKIPSDYWPIGRQFVGTGVCIGGGELDGTFCDPEDSSACGAGVGSTNFGECSKVEKIETHIGLTGYCLEFDYSRPINGSTDKFACLTWLPIDVSASLADVYNTNYEAGYYLQLDAPRGGEVYCLAATGNDAHNTYEVETDTGQSLDTLDELVDHYWDCTGDLVPCKPKGGIENMIKSSDLTNRLNVWALEVLGKNASMMRIEKIYYTNSEVGSNPWFNPALGLWGWINAYYDQGIPVPGSGAGGGPVTYAYGYRSSLVDSDDNSYDFIKENLYTVGSLVPTPFRNILEDGVVNGTHRDNGTLVHPPVYPATDPISYPLQRAGNTNYDLIKDNYALDTTMLRAGGVDVRNTEPLVGFKETAHWKVQENYLSGIRTYGIENNLFEGDIQKIFFVPIFFQRDNKGIKPALLTDRLAIDFYGLRYSDNHADTENALRASGSGLYPSGASSGGMVYTYVLDNDNGTSIPSLSIVDEQYADYSEFKYFDDNDDGEQLDIPESAKINRRYVLVFSTADGDYLSAQNSNLTNHLLNMINNPGSIQPPDKDQSPFKTSCNEGTGVGDNWFAIGLDFDKDGRFLGYITRHCHAGSVDVGGINFTVFATLNNQCTIFEKVYDSSVSPLTDNTNKAWTNRVYNNSAYTFYNDEFESEVPNSPFGSIAADMTQAYKQINKNNPESITSFRKRISFVDKNSGVPYSCGTGYNPWAADPYVDVSPECVGLLGAALSSEDSKYDTDLVNEISNESSSKTLDEAKQALRNLFAKTFTRSSLLRSFNDFSYFIEAPSKVWPWWWSNLDISNIDTFYNDLLSDDSFDISGDLTIDLLPPQIYSLNPATCLSGAAGSDCTAGEFNNVTVSGKNGTMTDYDGNKIPDEDTDNSGVPDAIIAQGSFTAVLQFFAFADDSRMPIRRVMVDWGDGNQPTGGDKEGLYKNRKPFCEENDYVTEPGVGLCGSADGGAPTLLTCQDDKDCPADTGGACLKVEDGTMPTGDFGDRDSFQYPRFGNLPRACTNEVFEFQHGYFCGINTPNRMSISEADNNNEIFQEDVNRLKNMGYKLTDPICVFKPRVQVLDNWGWCNGSCNGDKGCYSNVVVEIPDIGSTAVDYCAPGTSDLGWTNYKGRIIVTP